MIPPERRYAMIIPVLNETPAIDGLRARLRSLDRKEKVEMPAFEGDREGKPLRAVVREAAPPLLSDSPEISAESPPSRKPRRRPPPRTGRWSLTFIAVLWKIPSRRLSRWGTEG